MNPNQYHPDGSFHPIHRQEQGSNPSAYIDPVQTLLSHTDLPLSGPAHFPPYEAISESHWQNHSQGAPSIVAPEAPFDAHFESNPHLNAPHPPPHYNNMTFDNALPGQGWDNWGPFTPVLPASLTPVSGLPLATPHQPAPGALNSGLAINSPIPASLDERQRQLLEKARRAYAGAAEEVKKHQARASPATESPQMKEKTGDLSSYLKRVVTDEDQRWREDPHVLSNILEDVKKIRPRYITKRTKKEQLGALKEALLRKAYYHHQTQPLKARAGQPDAVRALEQLSDEQLRLVKECANSVNTKVGGEITSKAKKCWDDIQSPSIEGPKDIFQDGCAESTLFYLAFEIACKNPMIIPQLLQEGKDARWARLNQVRVPEEASYDFPKPEEGDNSSEARACRSLQRCSLAQLLLFLPLAQKENFRHENEIRTTRLRSTEELQDLVRGLSSDKSVPRQDYNQSDGRKARRDISYVKKHIRITEKRIAYLEKKEQKEEASTTQLTAPAEISTGTESSLSKFFPAIRSNRALVYKSWRGR
ncbi:hypothetical protein T439DRAFT_224269 [Meredithblackwellia eburnea MCA 4105]